MKKSFTLGSSVILIILFLFVLLFVLPIIKMVNITDWDMFSKISNTAIFKNSLSNSFVFGAYAAVLSTGISILISFTLSRVTNTETKRKIMNMSFTGFKTVMFLLISFSFSIVLADNSYISKIIGNRSDIKIILLVIWMTVPFLTLKFLRVINEVQLKYVDLYERNKVSLKIKIKVVFKSIYKYIILHLLMSFMFGFSINSIGLYGDYSDITAHGKNTLHTLSLSFATQGNDTTTATISMWEILVTAPFSISILFIVIWMNKTKKHQESKISDVSKKWKANKLFNIYLFLITILIWLPIFVSFVYSFRTDEGESASNTWTVTNYSDYWTNDLKDGVLNTIIYSTISAFIHI
ncbi:MAG: hypothetical protein KAG14_05165 [Mycoplasmataceae bacterium]|nr:hypothetical protein [Mycoplasmataceae bacterium]